MNAPRQPHPNQLLESRESALTRIPTEKKTCSPQKGAAPFSQDNTSLCASGTGQRSFSASTMGICFTRCIIRFHKSGIILCGCFMRSHPLRICTVWAVDFVIMYYSRPIRLVNSNREMQKLCQFFNVICEGSPSRMRRVRRISLGITTRPRSSMRLTIPVAFILFAPLLFLVVVLFPAIICKFGKNIPRSRAELLPQKVFLTDTGGRFPCHFHNPVIYLVRTKPSRR